MPCLPLRDAFLFPPAWGNGGFPSFHAWVSDGKRPKEPSCLGSLALCASSGGSKRPDPFPEGSRLHRAGTLFVPPLQLLILRASNWKKIPPRPGDSLGTPGLALPWCPAAREAECGSLLLMQSIKSTLAGPTLFHSCTDVLAGGGMVRGEASVAE